jgi:hypothetical protein
MVRLYLFVEGQTEQTFADNTLKPHLAQYGVYMDKPVLIANSRKKGKVNRGGGCSYQPMKDDILRFLKQDKSQDVFFTTMIDLYAIAPEFPKLSESEKLRHTPEKRVEFLEQAFGDDIGDRRFIPYIQLHEYEAYLFVNPSYFNNFYDDCEQKVKALMEIAALYKNPERINDSVETAPSKRIIAQFPGYERSKVSEGSQIAALITLEAIRAKCPHFNKWLSGLESLNNKI